LQFNFDIDGNALSKRN